METFVRFTIQIECCLTPAEARVRFEMGVGVRNQPDLYAAFKKAPRFPQPDEIVALQVRWTTREGLDLTGIPNGF